MDQRARIFWLNRAGEALFGFASEELKGSLLWERLSEPDQMNSARRHCTSIPAKQCTLNMRTKSGDLALMKWKVQWLSDSSEETGYVVMYATNDSELVNVQSDHSPNCTCGRKRDFALNESKIRFQALFDSAPEFILVVDPEGRIIMINRRVSNQSGYEPDEMIGKNIKDFFTEESSHTCDCYFTDLRNQGCNHAEIEFACKDGSILQMECSATAIPDKNNQFSSFLIIQRDTTERKRAAETPADSEITGRIRNFVSTINAEMAVLNIDELIVEVSDFLEWELRNSDVKITLDLDGQNQNILANSAQIERVLLGLVLNSLEAIQYARVSNGRLLLQTRVVAGDAIRITVSDNGPGIPADMSSRLFERLQARKAPATGMGLSIGRSIIQAHQGRIWLNETCKDGATFFIELPVIHDTHDTA